MTNQYPIDFDAVTKGQTFTTEELERITGQSPGTDAWVWELRGLQDGIQRRRLFTVKNNGLELRVLTDTEAALHNQKLFRQNMRGMFARHRLDLAVDQSNLTPDERDRHGDNLITQSRYLTALTQTTKEIRVEGRKQHPKRINLNPAS